MSTERIQIEVRQDGAQEVKRNLQDIGKAAQESGALVNLLKGYLAGITVQAIAKVGDEYANLQNKIREVSTSLTNANQITARLYDIAAKSRSSIAGVVDAYFTLDVALSKYGVTQERVGNAVETLSKAFTAFGTSTENAQLALVQLGQGFSKNRLETQDLKSILQSAPPLIDILAKNLDIQGFSTDQARLKLLDLADQGKITGTVMLKAIEQMSGEIDTKFNSSIKTIDQAVTVFSQNFKKAIGEILLNSGFTETISNGLLGMANNMNLVIDVAQVLGAGLGFLLLATTGLSAAMAVLNAILAVNPFILLATAAIIGIGAIYKLTQATVESTNTIKANGDASNVMMEAQAKGLLGIAGLRQQAALKEKQAFDTMKEARKDISQGQISPAVQAILNDLERENAIVLKTGDAYEVAKAQLQAYKTKKAELIPEEQRAIQAITQSRLVLERQKQAITDFTGPAEEYKNRVQALTDANVNGFITAEQLAKGLDDAKLALDRFTNQKTFSAGIVDGLNREIAALKSTGDQYTINRELIGLYNQKGSELTKQEVDKYSALIQTRIEMERQKSVIESVKRPWTEYEQTVKALNAAQAAGAITARQYTLAMDEQNLAFAKAKNQKTFSEQFVDDLKREMETLKLTGDAYAVATGLLGAYKQKGSELTDEETRQFGAMLQKRVEMERQKSLVEGIIGPYQNYENNVKSLSAAYQDGRINAAQFNQALVEQELALLKVKEAAATTFGEGFSIKMRQMVLETRNATAQLGSMFASIFGPGGTLSKGIGDAVAQAIVFGKSWKESIRSVAQQILSQLISAIVQIGVNMLLQSTIGQGIQAASTAGTVAQGAAITAAMTPAAAMTTLATGGTNAIGLSSLLPLVFGMFTSFIGGFREGGYTGALPENAIAGVVHGQEFVMNAAATRRNRSTLEALNAGKDPATFVAPPATPPVSIAISNQIPDAAYEVRQLNETEIEIIAKRVVRREAAEVIANDLRNPNSRTSKSMSANTHAGRRR